jgi:hypothetical protein
MGVCWVCVDADAPHVVVLGVVSTSHNLASARRSRPTGRPSGPLGHHTRTWEELVSSPDRGLPSSTAGRRETKTLVSALWKHRE